MRLSSVSEVVLGEVIIYRAPRQEAFGSELLADVVTDLMLDWENGWVVNEIWTALGPEAFGWEAIRLDQIQESIISSIPLHDPEIPGRPPRQVGDVVDFDVGDKELHRGTIEKIELWVDQRGGELRYNLKEFPNHEAIREEHIVPKEVANASASL